MADRTKIEWTGSTWNVINGCFVVSPGCSSCYAMRLAGTRMRNHPTRAGLTLYSRAGPVWNGEVRLVESILDQPIRWQRPRMIFPCAHGDLFYDQVPDEWIDKVFATMADASWHTYQVLTKRPARARAYLSDPETRGRIDREICRRYWAGEKVAPEGGGWGGTWPLPNVWLGTSVEDQRRAEERIPELLACPAAVRWISAEPLLGPVDLTNLDPAGIQRRIGAHGWSAIWRDNPIDRPWLDWIVVGGESGPGARPMDLAWAASLVEQCRNAGVAVFVKQLGARPMVRDVEPGAVTSRELRLRDPKGGDPAEWPDELLVREFPAAAERLAA